MSADPTPEVRARRAPLGAWRRVGVVALVVVTAVAGVDHALDGIRWLGGRASENASRDWLEREFAGASGDFGIDREALLVARELIPDDASYRLILGDRLEGFDGSLGAAEEFAHSFLLPRRFVESGGDWVICYGCDPASVESGFAPRWDNERGILIGPVRR